MAANRNWRSGGYNSYNQLLQPASYFSQPISYSSDRKYNSGYDDKRNRKDFQSGRRDRYSPNKRRSPQRTYDEHSASFRKDSRKSHHGGRYEVRAPRVTFDVKELSTSTVKTRYQRMYIPSDFFHASLRWQDAFPMYRPMKVANDCEYQILNKEVEVDDVSLQIQDSIEPEDADTKFSAKVMLLATPSITELLKRCTKLSDCKTNTCGKNLQFLVGTKGNKNEPMAIGGNWSPSLDGPEPETDPNVLIKTAIRTCKALTGIDLSLCKKWYKFMEINYYRPGDSHEEVEKKDTEQVAELKEDKIETVVIYIPDLSGCIPTEKQWGDLKKQFTQKLNELIPQEEKNDIKDESTDNLDASMNSEKSDVKQEEKPDDDENIANLKVTELRAKLTERGLDSKGVKNILVQRLKEAVEAEKNASEKMETDNEEKETEAKETEAKEEGKDEEKVEEKKEETVEETKVDTKPKMSEKEIQNITKIYTLNSKPSILVRPHATSKEAKFDCTIVTLDNLMEYRQDDQKEHIFEVSLFAEQLNEMLQRDALFYIYRSLINMSDLNTENEEPEAKKAKTESKVIRKSKMIPDLYLLYCFSLFDPDDSGYIRDHVLEYFIHNLGLNLSRSQVKKLINKIPNRKGSLMYKEVCNKEVVEGSVEDIAMLKMQIENSQKLAELAQGNKTFFEDGELESVARSGLLEQMDNLDESNFKKMYCELQLSMLRDEIEKLKKIQDQSGNVVTDLRGNIEKTKEKLETEKESHEKLLKTVHIYRDILKDASEAMGVTVVSINNQYEIERKAKEEERAAAEEKKKLEESAKAAEAELDDEVNESKTESS